MNKILKYLLLVAGLVLACGTVVTSEPIKLHPINNRYFLYKGKPTVLITSDEHYGAVLNKDFDYITYLDELKNKGLNYTLIFTGTYIEPAVNIASDTFRWWNIDDNTLGPTNNGFLCPWARSTTQKGFAGDPNSYKFDLSKWDDAGTPANSYFPRLRDFIKQADDRGIAVVIVFFLPFNEASKGKMWERSPMNGGSGVKNGLPGVGNDIDGISNNVNSAGNIAYLTSTGDDSIWDIRDNGLHNDGLTVYMSSMVTKIVQELNEFDNVIYESIGESWMGGSIRGIEFDNYIISKFVTTETSLPKKHLICQGRNASWAPTYNINPNASVFFYSGPPLNTIAKNYFHNIPIGLDELTYLGIADAPYRCFGWKWLMAGGAEYAVLDLTFTPGPGGGSGLKVLPYYTSRYDYFTNKSISFTIGGGGPALRTQMGILKSFMDSFDFVNMHPDNSIIAGALPSGTTAWALVQDGKQYAIYIEKNIPSLNVNLQGVTGTYKVEWVNTKTGNIDKTETFPHTGGTKVLIPPSYTDDIALRILDTADVQQPPVVSISTIGVINGSNPPATLTIKVNATAYDGKSINQVDFYNNSNNWIGTDTSSPYEFVWTVNNPGDYSITAKATDSGGLSKISTPPQVVTIGGTPPPPQHAYHPEDITSTLPWSVGSGTTTIQVEDYDMVTTGSGEGIAYHDRDTTNRSGLYRPNEGVDIGTDSDTGGGGYHVGWAQPGEWLEYSINVVQDGDYKIRLRSSNAPDITGPIHIEFIKTSSADIVTPSIIVIPDTIWRSIEVTPRISLTAGNQIMRLVMLDNVATYCGDLNYIELIRVSSGTVPPPPTITVTSPNGGETWPANSNQKVEWTIQGTWPIFVGNINIDLSTNGGTTWNTLVPSVPASNGSQVITIPNTPSTNCLIRVQSNGNGSPTDSSNANFTITAPDNILPIINITSPANNSIVPTSPITISGTASDNVGLKRVEVKVGVSGIYETATGLATWNKSGFSLVSGPNIIYARATDTSDNVKVATITVTYIPSTPPIITNVRASVTTNGAIITWTTDENSDTQVGYGTTTALGTVSPLDINMTRLHSVSITGLLKNKTYYYKVYSRDSSDNLATSSQYSFKTLNNIKHRIYTYYYDDGTTTTKVGASASASLKFKVQVYNLDENSLATDYTGTVTLTTKNSKSSVLDTTDSTLIEADAGEKEVAIPFRSDINTIELTGDVTAPVVINFSDMYIAKLVGYQGGSIRGSNGLKILIPTGVLSANKFLASIKTSAAPAVRNTMKYVNTVNPICYDFGELTFNNNAPVLENQVFTRAVNITIPYTKADIGTLNEDGLRIYYWTGTDWDLVTGVQTVDKANNTVTATVRHFSTYRILGSYVSADINNVKVYPTPYNPNTAVQGKLKIINLPMNCVMKLYSVTGEMVRELKEIDFGNLGWLEWDGKNDDGDKVGRGVYIYQIEDAAGSKKTGKIGLVK
ncbi:MAG: Ig-like domain-containing protein [Elusimicrobia bacterium]|nr:Ig-like domain-containing protein [Elusimicrobiota bacterium]